MIDIFKSTNNSNKNKWESRLDKFPEANFLQSWAWGEFHQKLGHPVYRFEFKGGIFQGVVEPARRFCLIMLQFYYGNRQFH